MKYICLYITQYIKKALEMRKRTEFILITFLDNFIFLDFFPPALLRYGQHITLCKLKVCIVKDENLLIKFICMKSALGRPQVPQLLSRT